MLSLYLRVPCPPKAKWKSIPPIGFHMKKPTLRFPYVNAWDTYYHWPYGAVDNLCSSGELLAAARRAVGGVPLC